MCVILKWKRPGAKFSKKETGQEVRKNDTYTNKHSLKILNMIMKHSIKSPSLTTFYMMIKYCPILYTGILHSVLWLFFFSREHIEIFFLFLPESKI